MNNKFNLASVIQIVGGILVKCIAILYPYKINKCFYSIMVTKKHYLKISKLQSIILCLFKYVKNHICRK